MANQKYSDRELQEGKTFQCILYPDSESYDCQLLINRLESFWDLYYYAYHDRDTYLELDYEKYKEINQEEPPWKIGDFKKPHYHVIGHKDTNCTLGMASKKFGIPSNMVERCKNYKKSVRYLIHRDNSDKFQYDISELITNDIKVDKFMKNDDATDKARLLLDFIFSSECENLYTLSNYAIRNGCWDELRRGQHIYTKLLDERKFNNER